MEGKGEGEGRRKGLYTLPQEEDQANKYHNNHQLKTKKGLRKGRRGAREERGEARRASHQCLSCDFDLITNLEFSLLGALLTALLGALLRPGRTGACTNEKPLLLLLLLLLPFT